MQSKEKEILQKVKRIEFDVRKSLSGVSLGVKTSTFKGHGMTFSDIRQYEPGDDIKNFAWKVMARTGDPYVKQFEEERDLEVHVAFDLSSSMNFGGLKFSKSLMQAYILAFLGLSTSKSKDKFGGLIYTQKNFKRFQALRGEDHVRRCLYSLVQAQEEEKDQVSDPNVALDYFCRLQSKNTLCVLVSDFIKPLDRKLLARARRRHKFKMVHIFDPYENKFPDVGWLNIKSALSSDLGFCKTSSKSAQALEKQFKKKKQNLEALCRAFGIQLVHQSTHDVDLNDITRALKLRSVYG